MELLLETAIILLIGCAVIILCLFIVLLLIIIRIGTYHNKLLYSLPWLRWLTIEDVVRMGHPRHTSALLLTIYVDERLVEIRPRDDIGQQLYTDHGSDIFGPVYIRHFEFRVIKRPPRRRRRYDILPHVGKPEEVFAR